jgi:hypothetical protein
MSLRKKILRATVVVLSGMLFAGAAAATANADTFLTWERAHGAPGKCMAVAKGLMAPGTKVIQFDCVGSPDQYWSHPPANNNTSYEIRNEAAGGKYCLAVPGQSTDPTQLIIWPCAGTDDQRWKIKSSNGAYVLVNENSALVVSVAGGSVGNNAAIVQYPYHYSNDQYWY